MSQPLLATRRFAPLFWCQFFAAFNDNGDDVVLAIRRLPDGPWETRTTSLSGTLKTPFRLGGGGTKRVPISRPLVLCHPRDGKPAVYQVDAEGVGSLPPQMVYIAETKL